ncbi:MAG: hypothetical protein HEEMFOPI_00237 [Holosporales bacterium]
MSEINVLSTLSPLCVDLDGTLIKEDVLWVSWRRLFKRSVCDGIKALFWLLKGRAYFKQQLALYSSIEPADLTYNLNLLDFLKAYKLHNDAGVLVLATAADVSFAKAIAHHLQIFDQVLASDGSVNLRAEFKADRLSKLFGEKQFSYIGNSFDDIKVWKRAKYSIAVNLSFKARFYLKFESIVFYKIFGDFSK